MFKIVSGSNASEMLANLNAETKPFSIVNRMGNECIIEKPDAGDGTASVVVTKIYPNGILETTTRKIDVDGKDISIEVEITAAPEAVKEDGS